MVNEPALASLTTRLDRLERENRRLKALCSISLLLIASLGILA